MICIHHNKDLDGFTSGAIVRKKFPDCKLIGWDYGLPIPEVPEGEDIIMIDISFPIKDMINLGKGRQLTILDHHISFKREYDETPKAWDKFLYIYTLGIAACEIGWKYFFSDKPMPYSVLLLGEYDTWRHNGTERWTEEILPFQFYMRTICTSPETFPPILLDTTPDFDYSVYEVNKGIKVGKMILKYQEQQDMLNCERGAFEQEVYGGLRGICLNQAAFSSETAKTVYNPERHDIMVGFTYNKGFWRISLRSIKDEIDVSLIAKERGGGGHKKAAGFEVKTFEEIFK